jgi:DNA-binding response OmpR family regulator
MTPDVDGFAVIRKLRGEPGIFDLPVIVITAMSEADSQAQALEIGADDSMTKPFGPMVLRARRRAVSSRRARLGDGVI